MASICISGTEYSDATLLTELLSKLLNLPVNTDSGILTGQLSWYTHPESYSIFCMKSLCDREDNEKFECTRKCYMDKYQIDLKDMRNYDLVIDTSHFDVITVLSTVASCYRNDLHGAILCGAQCYPTKYAIDMSRDVYESVKRYKRTVGTPTVMFKDWTWFVVDGHARLYGSADVPYICRVKTGQVKDTASKAASFANYLE